MEINNTDKKAEIITKASEKENKWFCEREALNVTVPEWVKSIDKNTFCHCTNLQEVRIPASVRFIGFKTFAECPSLRRITVDSANQLYDSRDNCNAVIDTFSDTMITACSNSTIPESVKNIAAYCFYGCTRLAKTEIPASVKKIYKSAFGLTHGIIVIPESIQKIDYHAFDECEADVYVPAGFSLNRDTPADIMCYRHHMDEQNMYDMAFTAYSEGYRNDAVKMFRAAALKGYAPAQYDLAVCYYNGTGVPRSYTNAMKWLKRAVKLHHARSILLYAGCLYDNSDNVSELNYAYELLHEKSLSSSEEAELLRKQISDKINTITSYHKTTVNKYE